MLPPEYKKMFQTCWACLNSMGTKKTKSCFLTLSKLESQPLMNEFSEET